MAIAGGSNIEYRKDEKTRYLEEDNIKDVTKEDLKTLKSTLKLDEETNLETQLTAINDNVERYFNGFLLDEWETSITLTKDDGTTIIDTPKNIIMKGNQEELNILANYVIDKSGYTVEVDKLKDEEIKTTLKEYKFVLKDLRKDIAAESSAETGIEDGNVMNNDLGEGTNGETGKEELKYESQNDYIDPYKKTGVGYATISNDMDIANIYKDNKMPKYMEEMFDDEEKEELHKGTFRINLGKEDGLAGIIIAIREAVTVGNSNNYDEESDAYKLYEKLGEMGILVNEDPIDIEISKDQLKELIEDKLLTYKDDVALSWNEKGKVAKILTDSHRSDLDKFASLLQSKSDEAMSVKEWHNANEMIKNKLINSDNVLNFLCDFNGDGQVAAEYKKKDNKEQKNQGDVGTLFGQQVMFTIEQAINTKNIELGALNPTLGDKQGEQLVIQNIVKNMQISDSRELDSIQKQPFLAMEKDSTKCTKENLAKLFNGDEEQGILPMPEMKVFFLDAIKKINGGSNEVNPDLYDTLVGKEAQSVISLYETEATLKTKLDEILTASKDPATIEQIRLQGLVRVRETLFTKIMTAIDHVDITTNNGAQTQLQAAGISKGRETRALKKELMEDAIKSLILSGIHYSLTGGWRFSIGYGKEGISASGQTKRARGVGGGLIIGAGKVELAIELSGEIAEQYNKNRVINADLSDVKSAKYFGLEGGAIAGIGTDGVDAEAYAGINRSKSPEVGINQIDKQYRAVSEEIFDITGAAVSTLADRTLFRAYIKKQIDALKTDGTYGKFVTKNEQHLTDDLDFMVRYMEANKFFGADGAINKLPKDNITSSINALIDIIQSGNIEQRRHDVISGLHGKVELTKLSFGVTTNALTAKFGGKGTNAPTAGVESGATPEGGEIQSGGAGGGSEVDLGQDRFGICGIYIGGRISTWKNSYVPNTVQYLFTQYETGQGIGAEKFDNPNKDLTVYGKYLEAVYNDPEDRLSCIKDPTGDRLIITFDPKGSDLTLAKFLNIHATTAAQKSFSLKGNVLTIGNVGDMAAYTITEAKGVRRILCLGTKKLDEATRVSGDNATTTVDAMKPVEASNKAWTKEKIRTDIISNMTGEGNNLETAKTTTEAFFDIDGKLVRPTGAEWAGKTMKFEPATIENMQIKQGTVLIQKNADETSYTITLDTTTSADTLTVIYRDEKEYTKALKIAQANTENRETMKTTEVQTLFNFAEGDMLTAKNEITKLLSSLEELENSDPQAYADFLLDASTVTDGNVIDDEELSLAIVHLEALITNDKNATTFDTLKGFLDGKNGEVKSYIVDRMKQILAREPMYKKSTIGNILDIHNKPANGWLSVKGPSNETFPAALQTEMKAKRAELRKAYATKKYETSPTIDENLIGYTAFYRERAQKYSITSLGETGYQGELKTITENTDSAQSRFFENLIMSQYEVDRLATSLEAQFLAQGTTVSLKQDNTTDTVKKIKELISLDGLIIDNGDKISIDVDWVFYLLGDCCNESLGMKIKNINITKFIPGTIVAGRYAATGTPDKEYKGGMELYTKSHSLTSRVITKEEKASLKHHKGMTKKPTPIVSSGADTGSGGTTEPGNINSGDNTGNE